MFPTITFYGQAADVFVSFPKKMKPKTRNILITLILVISVSISFYLGTFFGIDFGYKIYRPTMAMQNHSQAQQIQMSLEKIDKSEIVESHNILKMFLNGNIVILNQYLETGGNDETGIIKNLLSRISEHRKNYPEYYKDTIEPDSIIRDINKSTSVILDKYKN